MIIRFEIPGEPAGKGRPRSTVCGFAKTKTGKDRPIIRHYTPDKTDKYENLVKMGFKAVCQDPPMSGPVDVTIIACFAIPKSWTKKRLAAHHESPESVVKKPDADNIGKIVCDALNQIAYLDDSQVATLFVKKIYSHVPRVTVEIEGGIDAI